MPASGQLPQGACNRVRYDELRISFSMSHHLLFWGGIRQKSYEQLVGLAA